MGRFLNTTVARKFAMGISGLFLVLYLLLHVTVNFVSTISPEIYNDLSEFMGYNFIIQAVMQPILVIGVIFHFVMAFVLEIKNNKARPIKYAHYNKGSNTTWMSRNMIYTGGVVLLFLLLHMYDFFFPQLGHKFSTGYDAAQASDFYGDLVELFRDRVYIILYVGGFIFMML